MQDSFYRHFIDQKEKNIAFIGGGGKTVLIQRIVKDCQSIGKKVIIISLQPFMTPLDAKVFIASSLQNISQQLKKELKKDKIIYIGKKIENNTMVNFSLTEIKKHLNSLPCDHVFIEADEVNGCSLSGYKKVSLSLLQQMDRYINILGADAFNQIKNRHWLESEDAFWRAKRILLPMDIAAWYKSSTLFNKLFHLAIPATFFINKVENIYIENIAIPLAKSFKMNGVERVITGSVFNSNLHLIK
jgi:hypothetical protein